MKPGARPLLAALVLASGFQATFPDRVRAQESPWPMWFDLEPGPHAVGFTARWMADTTRSFGGDPARPLRILVWYPAVAGSGTAMRYTDYLGIQPADPRFEDYAAALARHDRETARRQFSPASDSLLALVEETPVAARRDARPGKGPYPFVIHSLGLGDYQLESTVLWEYLASHGYAVAVVPQVGPEPGQRLGFDPASVRTQVLDIDIARRALAGEPWLDAGRVGLLGHSFGGLAALVYESDHGGLGAIVTLDGSAVTENGIALANREGWTFRSASAPILNLFRATSPARDLSLFASASGADRYHVVVGDTVPPDRATHFDFQNWPVFGELVGVADPRGEASRPGDRGVAFYLTVCRLVRGFLDGAFGGDSDAIGALRRGDPTAGFATNLVRIRYEPGEP